ncbi:hypothetical protein BDW74DRAFT_175050 [Aspergillus multicolor]|uniref:uncharacterized protein n=1 Tax=Aspergillus multicolor TaxID=41759 RepID=UPI003CCD7D97
MARTSYNHFNLRPAPGSNPTSLFKQIQQMQELILHDPLRTIELPQYLSIELVTESFVVLMTRDFADALDPHGYSSYHETLLENHTDADHMCNRNSRYGGEQRAWKTTRVHEVINENHPRIVRFLGRDPWTALPLLERPSGGTLDVFMEEHRGDMYGGSCLTPHYWPLILQWALQLLSALSFVHSKDVIFGDLHTGICWLQSPSPNKVNISLLGFLDAIYMEPMHAKRYFNGEGSWGASHIFHPARVLGNNRVEVGCDGVWDRFRATVQTDLFLWACLVFELLTGCWPGEEMDEGEVGVIMMKRAWPGLEGGGCLERILWTCWEFGYADAEEVKSDLRGYVRDQGWEVEGEYGDEIKGIHVRKILDGAKNAL